MKLYSVQFLRAAAAILVVYCHSIDLQSKFTTSYQQDFYYLQNFGAIGVDIFFIISGFIISHISGGLKGKEATCDFLKKRFIRINPTYYFFSLIFFLVYISSYHEFSYKTIFKTLVILPIEVGPTFRWPVLTIGWTLSFEWFFYLIFSVLIFFKVNKKEFLMAIILPCLIIIGFLVDAQNVILKFVTNPLILEFVVGVYLGWLYKTTKVRNRLLVLSLLASLFWFILLVFYGYGNIADMDNTVNGPKSFLRVILWGTPSALLVFALIHLEKNNQNIQNLFKAYFIQLLGDASFAIYLVHPIIFFWLTIFYKKIGFLINSDLTIILQLVVAIAVGTISHIYLERNIVKYSFKTFSHLPFYLNKWKRQPPL